MKKFSLLIAGCLFAALAFAKNSGADAMPVPVVEVGTAQAQIWQQQVQATGSLAALQGIQLKPEIAGRITAIYFKSGQDVKQGDPLLNLDHEMLQAQLDLAQANLNLQQKQFQRASELIKTHAIAQADFDTARSNLETAQARVTQAQALLEQAKLTAPFSGRLGLRQVSLGDYVTAGQVLVNLQSLDPIIVNFNVPEVSLGKTQVGDTVLIRSDAFPGKTFTGQVYAFDSVIDPNTRSLAMRAKIPNPEKKLLPGGFVSVTLLVGQKQNAVRVPQAALVADIGGSYIYKVSNNKAVKTKINIIERQNDNAIIAGLLPGDKIITAGALKIMADNSPIQIISHE